MSPAYQCRPDDLPFWAFPRQSISSTLSHAVHAFHSPSTSASSRSLRNLIVMALFTIIDHNQRMFWNQHGFDSCGHWPLETIFRSVFVDFRVKSGAYRHERSVMAAPWISGPVAPAAVLRRMSQGFPPYDTKFALFPDPR
jgi:hypothetical protein